MERERETERADCREERTSEGVHGGGGGGGVGAGGTPLDVCVLAMSCRRCFLPVVLVCVGPMFVCELRLREKRRGKKQEEEKEGREKGEEREGKGAGTGGGGEGVRACVRVVSPRRPLQLLLPNANCIS